MSYAQAVAVIQARTTHGSRVASPRAIEILLASPNLAAIATMSEEDGLAQYHAAFTRIVKGRAETVRAVCAKFDLPVPAGVEDVQSMQPLPFEDALAQIADAATQRRKPQRRNR